MADSDGRLLRETMRFAQRDANATGKPIMVLTKGNRVGLQSIYEVEIPAGWALHSIHYPMVFDNQNKPAVSRKLLSR